MFESVQKSSQINRLFKLIFRGSNRKISLIGKCTPMKMENVRKGYFSTKQNCIHRSMNHNTFFLSCIWGIGWYYRFKPAKNYSSHTRTEMQTFNLILFLDKQKKVSVFFVLSLIGFECAVFMVAINWKMMIQF